MQLDVFRNWPMVCGTDSYPANISISTLLPDQKRLLWDHLKTAFPEVAQSILEIMDDVIALELMEKFGAELLIEEKYVPAQLRWLIRR